MTVCLAALAAVLPKYLPDKIAVGVCIVAVIGAVVGIGLWMYGRKLTPKEQKEWETKSLAIRQRSKEIDDILNTVEAMDNRLYAALPEAEKQVLEKPNLNKIFTLSNMLIIASGFLSKLFHLSTQSGLERFSDFMDEKDIGLEQYKKRTAYINLNSKLEKLKRLKSIEFRNEVDKFVRFSCGLNSQLLFFRIFKIVHKNTPLSMAMAIRRTENRRQQGIGNRLTLLALKLGEYTEDERDTTTV